MPYIETIAAEKAHRINNLTSIYGTFAEIGAGQEVVNHFFKAGQASQTVAKSMSAYDMTFSDEIYGRVGRYVSEDRLFRMLNHEYSLLQKRLKKTKGHNTRFFAFANTVAASTTGRFDESRQHGWMGVRFQHEVQAPYNEMILHVNLLDKTRLQQYEVLGILGVNLIYSAFFSKKNRKSIIKSLFDNFESTRVDIDVLRCSGNIFKDLDHHQINLELIHQGLTKALLFKKSGENILPSDALYDKNVIIYHHSSISEKRSSGSIKKIQNNLKKRIKSKAPSVVIKNVSVDYLKGKNIGYFLKQGVYKDRPSESQYILISDFNTLYELKDFIRKSTEQRIYLMLSLNILKQIFHKSFYKKMSMSVLEFFSRLCDKKTILVTFSNHSFWQTKPFCYLAKYLEEDKQIIHINCKGD